MPNIIGISALFHDSAVSLLQDGRLTVAAQEERFSRAKHDPSFPLRAFRFCLKQGGISINDIDCVAYYEEPIRKLERHLWMALPHLSASQALSFWEKAKRPMRKIREALGYEGPVEIVTHHQAHAASAFFFSGFEEAAILTVDAVGEWTTSAYGHGKGNKIELFEDVQFPHSIGLLYSTITSYLGFSVNDGEYKVMGLAPYGRPVWTDCIRQLIRSCPLGQFLLDMKYFDFVREDRMFSDALVDLFGHPPRVRESEIEQFHKDVASSLQVVLEEVLLEKCEYLYQKTGCENLCMAGGVALNCVANARILRDSSFQRLFVQPAAGDAGCSAGAAALVGARLNGGMVRERLAHVYLGPAFSSDAIASLLASTPVTPRDFRGREDDLLACVVDYLAAGKVVGWFHGRMEFGPRALGARSIIADPRDPNMRDRINSLIKMREAFRPFAPAVLESRAQSHFVLDHPSPFMLETASVCSSLDLPAITHVDNSARVQSVDPIHNPRFARLLECFEQRTGCPILLNTSFNMRDEPIVCSPTDALVCFVRSGIDALVLEDFVIDRSDLPPSWNQLRHKIVRPQPAISDRVYTLM